MLQGERGETVPETQAAKMAELANLRLGEMSDVQDARGLSTVLASFADMSPKRSRRPVRTLALVGVAAVALLVAGGTVGAKWIRKQPLTFVMKGGEIQSGGYFRIGEGAQPTIQFSDGSKVSLMALARGRVASIDEHGARVLLEDGSAHVEVVPRPGSRWMFDAGPFLVNVRGTEFDLGWKAAEGQLDVRLYRGAVSVTGPVSDQGISLHAGQWLTVRLATHEVFVRNLDQAASPALAPDPTPAPAVAPPAPASPEVVPAAPGAVLRARHPSARSKAFRADDADWAAARSAGEWSRIFDGAVRRGVDRTLTERSSEDLALLADAAHYLHRDDVAERALLAQRKRFPGSTRAKDAAFLLGRIVEARPGSANAALGWYDRHLEEAPDGVYASEALGRKMTVLGRLGGEQAARPVAEEYLRRYPAGSYARAARAYARTP
jgi:ferric-dicitrate binding protein FerR (iron transport regulator)/TolA-binding protein